MGRSPSVPAMDSLIRCAGRWTASRPASPVYTAIVSFSVLATIDAAMGLRVTGEQEEEGSDPSLIPYGNEPEGLGVSQAVGDVGMGLSGRQMLS